MKKIKNIYKLISEWLLPIIRYGKKSNIFRG